jgi:hypothetical protein
MKTGAGQNLHATRPDLHANVKALVGADSLIVSFPRDGLGATPFARRAFIR